MEYKTIIISVITNYYIGLLILCLKMTGTSILSVLLMYSMPGLYRVYYGKTVLGQFSTIKIIIIIF